MSQFSYEGSMMVPSNTEKGYPRVCAHRGFNTIAPENSLIAFGAAVSLGADEIEFDVWTSSDGKLVSMHDPTLDRVSNGTGKVYEHTFEELRKLDFGCRKGEAFAGLPIVTFEEILKKFSNTVIMNIHVKIWSFDFLDPKYDEIAGLIHKYNCQDHVYLMSNADDRIREFMKRYPDIPVTVGFDQVKEDPLRIVRRAISLGAKKVQLFKPYFTEETVKYAKENGIRCNVFYADDPEEACRYLDMGIDTILTNDYLRVSLAVRKHLAEKEPLLAETETAD